MFSAEKENDPFRGGMGIAVKRWFMRTCRRSTILSLLLLLFIFAILVPLRNQASVDAQDEEKDTENTMAFAADSPPGALIEKKPSANEKMEELSEREQRVRLREEELERKEEELRQLERQLRGGSKALPGGTPTPSSSKKGHGADLPKRNAVKQALLYAWNGYVDKAWGTDELRPIDGSNNNWLGLGLTIVDALDTLWLMDLKDEFQRGRDWIAQNMDFNKNRDVSLFETTIRVLGGLLSAYEFSKDRMFLEKATDLGDRFLPAFNTQTGIPYCTINLQSGRAQNPGWTGGASILSEVGTLQLEFEYLSHHTGNPIYGEKAVKVFDQLARMNKPEGLYSVYVSPNGGGFQREHVTLGALGDSYYEYLLKYTILVGDRENSPYRQVYDEAAGHIIEKLVKKSTPNNLVYIAEYINRQIYDKMDHLVCFAGAMFGLGAQGSTKEEHLELGKGITKTCYEMYHRTATGIAPELVHFGGSNDFIVPQNAKHYLLRPETVESFFVMWRLTHDPIYREWGWEVFQNIDKYCKARYGYSGIRDVTDTRTSQDNLQQSFFLAETLKYLYLLFSEDELVPLDKYVFNTEAHPLGVFKK